MYYNFESLVMVTENKYNTGTCITTWKSTLLSQNKNTQHRNLSYSSRMKCIGSFNAIRKFARNVKLLKRKTINFLNIHIQYLVIYSLLFISLAFQHSIPCISSTTVEWPCVKCEIQSVCHVKVTHSCGFRRERQTIAVSDLLLELELKVILHGLSKLLT